MRETWRATCGLLAEERCEPMNMVERLKKARSLIVKGWTAGQYARDIHGKPVLENSEEACSWCAVGALHATEGDSFHLITRDHPLMIALKKGAFYADSVSAYNDSHTKEDVLSLYDSAIQIAESQLHVNG